MKILYLILGLVFLQLLVGCAHREGTLSDATAVDISAGGGIAGAFHGYTIEKEGTISKFKYVFGVERERKIVCKNQKAAEQIFSSLDKAQIDAVMLQETANINLNLRIKYKNKVTHSINWWKRNPSPDIDPTSEKLNEVYNQVYLILKEYNCL